MISIIVVVVLLLAPGAALAQDVTFDSAGTPLYYRSAGSGTPAVLLSGGPGFTVDYMVPVGDFLPAGYRRIFFEQRGTGKSRPPRLSPETMTIHALIPGSTLAYLNKAGHFPWNEQPDEFRKIVAAFLGKP